MVQIYQIITIWNIFNIINQVIGNKKRRPINTDHLPIKPIPLDCKRFVPKHQAVCPKNKPELNPRKRFVLSRPSPHINLTICIS